LQIPSSFLVRLVGSRNTICLTTALLILPAAGMGLALQSRETPFWIFQLLAVLSGIGGGNFASSMSNIGSFFPSRSRDFALGLNTLLGVSGVALMQILLPLVVLAALFGGTPMLLEHPSGIIIDKVIPGTPVYLHNAGYVWLLFLLPLVAATWLGINNIRTPSTPPEFNHPLSAFLVIALLLAAGFTAIWLGLWLLSPETGVSIGFSLPEELVLLIVIACTVTLLGMLPGRFRLPMEHVSTLLSNRHSWLMSVLYTMTFGSFIGFSAAFALCIKVVFGFSHVVGADGVLNHDTINIYGPSALMYAWMGPFIAILIRSVGGWMAEKAGGAVITQYAALVMMVSALIVAHYLKLAYHSASPEEFFVPFFLWFLLLFGAIGIGIGSSLHTMSDVFDKEQVGTAINWVSAIAAFGAFYIPIVMAEQIEAATPEQAFYGFAMFYGACMLINGWFYLYRKDP
jgi:NNP family nitrate/nitrite transporter-like MFS transporter